MTDKASEKDDLLLRLRSFHSEYFPLHQQRFQDLVAQGQHPKTLFIGCSDSRLVPYRQGMRSLSYRPDPTRRQFRPFPRLRHVIAIGHGDAHPAFPVRLRRG